VIGDTAVGNTGTNLVAGAGCTEAHNTAP